MNTGQGQFYDFILERTQEDKTQEMKALLSEGFDKQENGSFDFTYFKSYCAQILAMLRPEHVEEVKKIIETFGRDRLR